MKIYAKFKSRELTISILTIRRVRGLFPGADPPSDTILRLGLIWPLSTGVAIRFAISLVRSSSNRSDQTWSYDRIWWLIGTCSGRFKRSLTAESVLRRWGCVYYHEKVYIIMTKCILSRRSVYYHEKVYIIMKKCISTWRSVCYHEEVYIIMSKCILSWRSVHYHEEMYIIMKKCILSWRSVYQHEEVYIIMKKCILSWRSVYYHEETYIIMKKCIIIIMKKCISTWRSVYYYEEVYIIMKKKKWRELYLQAGPWSRVVHSNLHNSEAQSSFSAGEAHAPSLPQLPLLLLNPVFWVLSQYYIRSEWTCVGIHRWGKGTILINKA